MNTKIKTRILPIMATTVVAFTLCGCMDEVTPQTYVNREQVESMTSSQEGLLNGIVAFTNDLNTWGASGDDAYYLNDWGYPCQMYYRDILTADFPIYEGASYNYWISSEQSLELRYSSYYTYNYYYKYVKKCNDLINVIDPETASSTSLAYLGCALTFRALCYFDMARLFEYKKTGYASLDAKAEDVMGLTVTITDENTTAEDLRNKARAPFYTMYRFILSDLNKAVKYLDGFERTNGNYPDLSVAYGLLARYWLEVGTRFENSAEDLAAQIAHENDEDGYAALGITDAKDCFKKAQQYARLAESGYTPMSQSEWTDPETGFNTATKSWMLYCSLTTEEQEGYFYSNFNGSICTEASWAMPQYGNSYREICSYLYNKMPSSDWRKLSWIAPADAGKEPASKYRAAKWTTTDATSGEKINSEERFKKYPAYSNLKFRARNNLTLTEGMKADLPMMRVEEMYFIDAEATAHVDGVGAGAAILQNFMNSWRYTDGSYECTASDIDSFTEELFTQKRIEFWGEGLSFFDYKRLRMPVLRSQSSNYSSDFQQDSKAGYVSPTMNLYILEYSANQNAAMVLNPDCTGWNKL